MKDQLEHHFLSLLEQSGMEHLTTFCPSCSLDQFISEVLVRMENYSSKLQVLFRIFF